MCVFNRSPSVVAAAIGSVFDRMFGRGVGPQPAPLYFTLRAGNEKLQVDWIRRGGGGGVGGGEEGGERGREGEGPWPRYD